VNLNVYESRLVTRYQQLAFGLRPAFKPCVPDKPREEEKDQRRLTMKTNLTRTLILAAVALIDAASAFAQNKGAANVPFSFRAFGKDLPAGAYSLIQTGNVGGAHLMLRNQANGHAALLPIAMPADDSKNARPRLVFRCNDSSGCSLAAVWLADGHGWKLPTPRLKPAEIERMAFVYLEPSKAE
jgi:hypothetical protein